MARKLAAFADRAPTARVELDQVHCDVETKIRRVLALHEAGALDGRRILLLGDDDLTSLAISLVSEQLGVRPVRIVVLEIDWAIAAFLRRAPFDVRVVVHDLREQFRTTSGLIDTVFTDPPYTVEGATLFLSRAAEAVAGQSRADVFFAFGGKRPEELLHVQRAIAEMGFVVRRLCGTSTSTSAQARSEVSAICTSSRARASSSRCSRRATTAACTRATFDRRCAATGAAAAAALSRSATDRRGRRSRHCAATAAPAAGAGRSFR